MPKDMTSIRHDRLSRVMAFLQSRVRATHDEIYSVGEYSSNRTLQNDLYYLRGVYGADIKYDSHNRNYVMESAGIFELNLRITKSEIESLTAGLRMSAHFLPHLKKSAGSLWDKLCRYIPEEIISHGSEIVNSTMMLSPAAKVDAEVFSTLINAKHEKKTVNILYSAPERRPKQWLLSPYDFYFRGNAWYMASYNHKYNNLGIHRVSRIISASISDEKYMPPGESGFTDEYVLSAWHVIPGYEKNFIRVRITEPLAESFREIKWHPTQKISECDEGGIILTAEVPNLYEVARWVMSGAPHIEVIEPDELKNLVRDFANKILNSML
ncbi:MAG: WYL domain-containing protein [Synergistaceae bacterium]|nr:WYL domain-containing protein [Synergistaceae bacterium]